MLAVCAFHFSVPPIVAEPWSSVDLKPSSGSAISIEEREPAEVLTLGGDPIAPIGMQGRSPAFDATAADLIGAIGTERGVERPPYRENLARLA